MALVADALLFDLDGVLVDSNDVVEQSWRVFADRHGLDPALVVSMIHGRRAVDIIAELAPGADAAAESEWMQDLEVAASSALAALPGAGTVLCGLPVGRWAVVTSGTRRVATTRLRGAGLPVPPTLVAAEDIEAGKPDPAGYRLAASRLGVSPGACVVFEDAPPGIVAARGAGATPVGVATTRSAAELTAAGSHAVIGDLSAATVSVGDRLSIELLPTER